MKLGNGGLELRVKNHRLRRRLGMHQRIDAKANRAIQFIFVFNSFHSDRNETRLELANGGFDGLSQVKRFTNRFSAYQSGQKQQTTEEKTV